MNKIYIDRVFKSYLLERYFSLKKEKNGPPLKIHNSGKKHAFRNLRSKITGLS